MAVNPANSVNPNRIRPSDSTSGSGVVSDANRSQRSNTSFKPEQFRGATGSGQPLTPIARNYVSRVADVIERGKLSAGRKAYANMGAPARTSIDNAVNEVRKSGLLNRSEANEMGLMIAKVLKDNGIV